MRNGRSCSVNQINMWIVNNARVWFVSSIVLLVLSGFSMWFFGFKLGIDFTGGSITEMSFEERPSIEAVREKVATIDIGNVIVRPSGDKNILIKSRHLTEVEKETLLSSLSTLSTKQGELVRYNAVGPSVGSELARKALLAVSMVILAIAIFIIFAFRKVSKPVASWKYGIATIVSLVHDVAIPTAVFVVLGHYLGYEIDLLFVAALLAVMGYSVHDTIVVFDRVRENLRRNEELGNKEEFNVVVGHGLLQTMGRSINTSLTTLFALVALLVLGGESTRGFTIILIAGILVGTYSSIFLASPLLVWFKKMQDKKTE